jgi:hypothetical protein
MKHKHPSAYRMTEAHLDTGDQVLAYICETAGLILLDLGVANGINQDCSRIAANERLRQEFDALTADHDPDDDRACTLSASPLRAALEDK